MVDSQFCFVIASYNNSANIERNLKSIINQTYKDWRVIYINDCSTDNTEELFFNIINKYDVQSKFTYIKNDTRMYQMYSKYNAYKLVDDFEIVCILDGDDWLSDRSVLDRLTDIYSDQTVDMVSSNFYMWENDKFKENNFSTYSEDIVDNKKFRDQSAWLICHLKTGYGVFFKSIPKEYLTINNEWLKVCTDVAEYYSALEFSKGKYLAINDVMYVYNKTNSIKYNTSYFNKESEYIHKTTLEYILGLPKCKYELPKTYIINMAKSIKHRKYMGYQMAYQSNINYKFIEAIDGSTNLETSNLMKKYFKYMDIKNDSESIKFNSSIIDESYKRRYNFSRQHITNSSLGLIQSVFLLLSEFVESENEHALILEDDVYTIQNYNDNLFINEELLKDKDLVYLGCHTSKHDIYPEKSNTIFINILKHPHLIYGTYAIIISKRLARYILNLGIDTILQLNLSWDLLLNYIRDTQSDTFTFFLYFKQLFIPNVIKYGGVNQFRDITFYLENNIILQNYYIPGTISNYSSDDIANIMSTHSEENMFDFVNKAVYINLDHRIDRREHIKLELSQCIDDNKIVRFSAISHDHGAIGCGLSHIAVLELAIAENWDNVFIMEDDLKWSSNFITGYNNLKKIIKSKYDVIVLGGTYIKSYKDSFKLIECQCALAYIVNKSYYHTLLQCFKDAVYELTKTYIPRKYAIDVAWKKLQRRDNWYIIKPNMCNQLPSYSDIENTFKDYTIAFNDKGVEYSNKSSSIKKVDSSNNKEISIQKTSDRFGFKSSKLPNPVSKATDSDIVKKTPQTNSGISYIFQKPRIR
jgi:glycosyl transferase family 25